MSVAELVSFTKKELDADADRQAKLQAIGAGELPRESHAGATLDLSNKNIHALTGRGHWLDQGQGGKVCIAVEDTQQEV